VLWRQYPPGTSCSFLNPFVVKAVSIIWTGRVNNRNGVNQMLVDFNGGL